MLIEHPVNKAEHTKFLSVRETGTQLKRCSESDSPTAKSELVTEDGDDLLPSGPPGPFLFKTSLEEAILSLSGLFVGWLSVPRLVLLQSESSNGSPSACPFTGTSTLDDDKDDSVPASVSLPEPVGAFVLESELSLSLSGGFAVSDTVCCLRYLLICLGPRYVA